MGDKQVMTTELLIFDSCKGMSEETVRRIVWSTRKKILEKKDATQPASNKISRVVTWSGGKELSEVIADYLEELQENPVSCEVDVAWDKRMHALGGLEGHCALPSDTQPGTINLVSELPPQPLQRQVRLHEDDLVRLAVTYRGQAVVLVACGPLTSVAMYGVGLDSTKPAPLSCPERYVLVPRTVGRLTVTFPWGGHVPISLGVQYESPFVQLVAGTSRVIRIGGRNDSSAQ